MKRNHLKRSSARASSQTSMNAMIVTWKRPAKHNMKLNQTHFRWTSCERWRSKKWFEKGGRQRSFSAGRYLKTRDYMWYYHILSGPNNSGPLMLSNVFPRNDWFVFISHIWKSMILRIQFSQHHALASRIFSAGFLLDVRPIPKRYRCAALMKECCALGVAKKGRKSVWFMKP